MSLRSLDPRTPSPLSPTLARAPLPWALAAGLALAAGCLPAGGECERDEHCASGLECSNTGDCEPAGTLASIRIFWTFNGVSPVPQDRASCAGADHLSVSFSDLELGEHVTFKPVLCSLGQILFDRMSARFDEVTVKAHAASGSVLDQATGAIAGAAAVIEVDLQP